MDGPWGLPEAFLKSHAIVTANGRAAPQAGVVTKPIFLRKGGLSPCTRRRHSPPQGWLEAE